MRIVVCIKQVLDPKSVKISRSREDFDLREAVKILNPGDKYVLEAALRLREALGGEIIALTIGDAGVEDVAREAIAYGADSAVLVQVAEPLAGSAITALVAAAIGRLDGVELALTGHAGATDGTGSLAARLAVALDWPLTLDVIAFEADAGEVSALALDGTGAARKPLAFPAVAAVMPGPQRPRYPHPARIAVAWEPGLLQTWNPIDLGLTEEALAADVEPGGLILGPERVRGQVIGGAVQEATGELLNILRTRRIVMQ